MTRSCGRFPLEDKDLAEAAARGDQGAFSTLVVRHRPSIYTLAYKISLNEEDALDITQNVLLRLVEKISSFDGRGTFRAWLAVITAREAFSQLRRLSRRREKSVEPRILERMSDQQNNTKSSNAKVALDAKQQRQLVEHAMARLSPQQRTILALRLREDIGPKEIAERLGLPARQVRSQLHRAIARIRQALAKEI